MALVYAIALLAVIVLFSVLSVGVALFCRLLMTAGLLRRRAHFSLVFVLLMVGLPAWSIWEDHVRQAACYAADPTDFIGCSGELGGFLLDCLRSGSLLGGLFVGPFISVYLARRWIVQKDNETE